MLDIRNLTFRYPNMKGNVLDDVSMRIEGGGIYGLLGPNGAGKSTLLYLISGLLTPKRGEVLLYGQNTRQRRPQTLSQIFIVPEEFDFPKMKLTQYVNTFAPFYPRFSFDDMTAHLERFGFTTDIHLHALSMGQKKKVQMCFALATNTPLLLMDEPTNGLDIPSKASFRSFMAKAMTDDKAVIISTHQVRDIDQLLDHVIIMNHNRVLLNEPLLTVAQRLAFGQTMDPREIETALMALPDVMGTMVVKENLTDEETPVNLELLFQLVVNRPDVAQQIFSRPANPQTQMP